MRTKNRTALDAFERTNQYVFHGSALRLGELEPRQAYCHATGERLPDGPPAIFATHFVDFAIFMAVINRSNCQRGLHSSCDFEDGTLIFGASVDTVRQLNETSIGYVHLFHRHLFSQRNEYEWACFENLKPVEIVQVCWPDFDYPIKSLPAKPLS
jgi:hypothetical protein